jgi:Spy/CpxP family protein refolding chaperone
LGVIQLFIIKKGEMSMHGLKDGMRVAAMVVVVTGGTSWLVGADPGSGHDPHGQSSHSAYSGHSGHSGMGYEDGAYEGMEHYGSLSPLAMKDQLGLSDDQVNQLRPLEMEYRKTLIHNEADLQVAMVDMGVLLDAKQPDRAAIARKVDEIGQLQKDMMLYRVDAFLKLKETLTHEQYEDFRARLRAHMEGMTHHDGDIPKGPKGIKGHGEYPGTPDVDGGEGSKMPKQHP